VNGKWAEDEGNWVKVNSKWVEVNGNCDDVNGKCADTDLCQRTVSAIQKTRRFPITKAVSAVMPVADHNIVFVDRVGSMQRCWAPEQLTWPVQLLIGYKAFIYKRHGFTNK
jgi:hypothetical protein